MDRASNTICLDVRTPSASYEVVVGAGLIEDADKKLRSLFPAETRLHLVSDTNVWPLYGEKLLSSLGTAGFAAMSYTVIPAGEHSKSVSCLSHLWDECARHGLTRHDCIIALGGGVVCDLAGFAAATYLRGCHVVHIPTTLLAMVDASVGGKCAIDLPAGKNLAGAFFQPDSVLIDVATLKTLPSKEFQSGCAEIIKHTVLADAALFSLLETGPADKTSLLAPDAQTLVKLIAANIRIKRAFVAADETDAGRRHMLNLGHTIGHAIEAASDCTLSHGACVAAGLCCLMRGASDPHMHLASAQDAKRIEALVSRFGLPVDTTFTRETLMDYVWRDKKRRGSSINAVIPTKIGSADIVSLSQDEMRTIIEYGCGTGGTAC